ncbi:hypothetical protein ACWC0C_46305 [Streptomyces sp. NPDC001709]
MPGYHGEVVQPLRRQDPRCRLQGRHRPHGPPRQRLALRRRTWTTDKRKKFANDLDHSQLIDVSAASNRSKGDQSPDQWAPPNKDYWCTYSRAWTDIKHLYGLSITPPEKTKLTEMLNTCD